MLKSENPTIQLSNLTKEDEEILAKTERDLKFLILYAKIGESLDRNIRAITQKLKDWLADANRVIEIDDFVKAEERYVHYKNKITRLISDVEEREIAGKKISERRKRRIQRVRFFFLLDFFPLEFFPLEIFIKNYFPLEFFTFEIFIKNF